MGSRSSQLALRRPRVGARTAHRRFCVIHGRVGRFQQARVIHPVLREYRNADAAGHLQTLVLDAQRARDALDRPLYDRCDRFTTTLQRQHHDELIAAQARHDVAFTRAGRETRGDLLQQFVARGVPQMLFTDLK
jgi:hypothetical protein